MHKLRTAITAFIALALAGLPVPAVAMHASMAGSGIADTAISAGGDHCCPQMEDCATPAKKGCDRTDTCAAKCAALSANVLAEIDLPPLVTPSRTLVVLAERLTASQAHPALPPPRL